MSGIESSGAATPFFALTTRGLEAVSAGEIAALTATTVREVGYRRVAAATDAPPASLLQLRTVDDVFVEVARWPDIGRPRSALAGLNALGARLDLRSALALCSEVRPIGDRLKGAAPSFAISASFVGKRNYSTDEIKAALADAIAARHGWDYRELDADADLNVRLFIEHEMAFVGVRLGQRPLQERAYKQSHVAGSLKPPVAAALLRLAGVEPGMSLLDPCCGAGTILIEAALMGALPLGGDRDAGAVLAAQANAVAAGVDGAAAVSHVPDIRQWDAGALPLGDGLIERIVCNLPWGRQVAVDDALAAFLRRTCSEMQRVLAPVGCVALLSGTPHLIHFPSEFQREEIEISLFGQTPTVVLLRA